MVEPFRIENLEGTAHPPDISAILIDEDPVTILVLR
jgi:hypothetical protein